MSQTASAAGETRQLANITVAKNIKAELVQADLNQADLAQYLGQNEMWLSRRMKNVVAFSTNEVADIADFFGVDVGELFRERERRAGAPAARVRRFYFVEPSSETVQTREFAGNVTHATFGRPDRAGIAPMPIVAIGGHR